MEINKFIQSKIVEKFAISLAVKFHGLWKFVVFKYVGLVVYNINKRNFMLSKLCVILVFHTA